MSTIEYDALNYSDHGSAGGITEVFVSTVELNLEGKSCIAEVFSSNREFTSGETVTVEELISQGVSLDTLKNTDGSLMFSPGQVNYHMLQHYGGTVSNGILSADVPTPETIRMSHCLELIGQTSVLLPVDQTIHMTIADMAAAQAALSESGSNEKHSRATVNGLSCFQDNHANEPAVIAPIKAIERLDLDPPYPAPIVNDEDEEEKLVTKLVNSFCQQFIVRSFKQMVYIYDRSLGYYRLPDNLSALIDAIDHQAIIKNGSASIYKSVETFLSCNSEITVFDDQALDPSWWVFRNFIVSTLGDSQIPNNGQFFVRSALNCDYDPNATCEVFDSFLYSICNGDEQTIHLVWLMIGYLLSDDTRGKCFFYLWGPSNCGKSTLAEVITKTLCDGSVSGMSPLELVGNFAMGNLFDTKLITCMDVADKKVPENAIEKLKKITGRDLIRADVKNQHDVNFRPLARILYGSNFSPKAVFPDNDIALYNRLVLIRFENSIPKDQQDRNLSSKLLKERSGIAVKAMKYYKELVDRNYIFPSTPIVQKSVSYDTASIIMKFVELKLCFTGAWDDTISSSELYTGFLEFSRQYNISTTVSENTFSRHFKNMYAATPAENGRKTIPQGKVLKVRITNGPNGFRGLRWVANTVICS